MSITERLEADLLEARAVMEQARTILAPLHGQQFVTEASGLLYEYLVTHPPVQPSSEHREGK